MLEFGDTFRELQHLCLEGRDLRVAFLDAFDEVAGWLAGVVGWSPVVFTFNFNLDTNMVRKCWSSKILN